MRKLINLLLIMIPFATSAQKNLFMNEFNGVNNWFFTQPQIALVQKYLYYNDSTMVHAVDSSVCTIIKNNTAIDYKANGLESFSDSGYMVKINHAGKYMIVSKIPKTDTPQLRAIFSQGFAGFGTFIKRGAARDMSDWELSGGTAGINSARLVMDLKAHRIKFLEMFMAANHPLVSPFKKAGQAADPTVIIKVEYQYPAGISTYDAGMLSDFITINGVSITPSAKYKDYRIKIIAEKQ
ncbi:hypothetical protein [Mucilaginibacter sp.]|uniref:hypothetical protein n=1 Tax=Mucilaginibacter sp. TaxID=1882438 RepID=UPI00284DC31C|nr:hypothetical protein [Mucilaginibacter sp.]MDR3697047.1 hypothetical protein [Mucilaginibacter sp.]